MYCRVPDSEIPLTARGHEQGRESGAAIRGLLASDGGGGGQVFICEPPLARSTHCHRLIHKFFIFFIFSSPDVSPYKRTKQTTIDIVSALPEDSILGIREEPQLREQDFGNFQDLTAKAKEKVQRNLCVAGCH